MRISRDGGRTYQRRYERDITAATPNQPAAVLIYDKSGCARTFTIDLDASKGGPSAVDRDYAALSKDLNRAGASFFADRSPNGGIHVYVPLEEPLVFSDAAAAARALATRTPTMDPMPMLGLLSGCIRPTGARHRSGGHQQLIGTLTAAYVATQTRTTSQAWERFTANLVMSAPADTEAGELEQLTPLGRIHSPDDRYQQIARTGVYDQAKYRSPSEARQAVIWSAVASGWTFTDVTRRVSDGTWPGLASFYARYRHGHHKALVRDWQSAIRLEKHRRETTQMKDARVGPTSELKTHGGGIHEQIRTWRNATELAFPTSRDDLAARVVLAALAEAAHKRASMTIEFGNRSLAIATGLNHRTVGKILVRLRDESEPLIDLVAESSGVKANVYQLVIPESLALAASATPWKKGKAGVRSVFRELGRTAAFTYAALEQVQEPRNGRDIARAARLSASATYDALETLQAWNLAVRTTKGWKLGVANLDQLAEMFGIVEQVKAQIEQYRAERRAWWALLGIIRLVDATGSVGTYDHPPGPEPPAEDSVTLMDMLERELGAYLVAEEPTRQVG